MNLNFLTAEEKTAINLKRLYKSYGYSAYGLASFEEYSLYTQNVNFLSDGKVATFNAGGKLLALRPDVTLSIIKNIKLTRGETAKIFYDEKVYRTPVGSKDLKEVSQIGAEIIGEVDVAAQAELLTLAKKTLNEIDSNYVLDVAHMGVISAFLLDLNLSEQDGQTALTYLKSKNLNGFENFIKNKNCSKSAVNDFKTLISCDGESGIVLPQLKNITKNAAAISAICELESVLNLVGDVANINIDFSIVNSSEYYNGVIFKGYVSCVPQSVLTGGRYDNLAKTFNKNLCAIGFALYLGELTPYIAQTKSEADIAVIYNQNNAAAAFAFAQNLRKGNKSVLICKSAPADFKGKIILAEEVLK